MTLIFSSIIISLISFNIKVYKKLINPLSVFAFPFLFIVIIINFFGDKIGYYKVSDKVLFIILICIISFFVGNVLILFFSKKNNIFSKKKYEFKNLDFAMGLAISICFFSFIVLYLKAYYYVGIVNFYKPPMTQILKSGIFAHLVYLGYPAFYYYIIKFIKTGEKRYFFLIFIYIFLSFGTMTKYHVLFPIVGSFFFLSFHVKKTRLFKYILICLMIIIILFMTNYLVFFLINNNFNLDKIIWSLDRLLFYIVNGPIVFSEHIENNIMPNHNISIFTRVSNVLLPKATELIGLERIDYKKFFKVNDRGFSGNVITFLGESYYFLGLWGSVTLMVILGFIVSLFYKLAFITKNLIIEIFTSHLLTIIFLMFFGNYFSLLPIWERMFFILFIPILTIFKNNGLKIKFLELE